MTRKKRVEVYALWAIAGAAAAALWVTFKCLPLAANKGFGPILAKSRQAALKFHELIETNDEFEAVIKPELDIVAYFPKPAIIKASEVTKLTNRLFETAMNDNKEPLYTARMKITPPLPGNRFGGDFWDEPEVTVLRSVLMKPEHLAYIGQIYERLEGHLRKIRK